VTLGYVRACGGDVEEWERRWREVAAELDVSSVPAEHTNGVGDLDAVGVVPYRGLAAFGAADAEWFFGREEVTAELVSRVSRQRFLAVFGASGSGKSSLLRAGLAARIASGDLGGGTSWPVAVLTPGSDPPMSGDTVIPAALSAAPITSPGLLGDAERLGRDVARWLSGWPTGTELVLVVDQFEEVFTLCADDARRTRFIDTLVTVTRAPAAQIRVVLGMRTDFYTHCARQPLLVEATQDAQFLVGPMTAEQLRRAIVAPAVRAGCSVETGLVAELVADAAGRPGVLPLVSHALLETYRRRRGMAMTVAAYHAAGGIHQAAARTAEQTFARLSPAQQEITKGLFLRLTALGETTEETRRRVTSAELDHDNPDLDMVLDAYLRARLLTADRDTVDIAHEALIRSWPRLQEWLAQDRDGLRLHRQLTEATQAWQSLNRDADALYRGTRLALAREWAATHTTALSPAERAFLDASAATAADEHAATLRRTRRLRRLVALLVALVVAAGAASLVAVRAQRTATDQAAAATEQRTLAISQKVISEAYALAGTDPDLAAQLVLAAYRLAPTPDNRDSLLRIVAASNEIAADAGTLTPDNRALAVDIEPDRVRLIDVYDVDRTSVTLLTHPSNINNITFSGDGRLLAIAYDDTVHLWDVSDHHRPVPLPSYSQPPPASGCGSDCFNLAFSPDAHLLAVTGYNRATKLIDLSNPRQPADLAVLPEPGSGAAALAFSPDSRTLAVRLHDHGTQLWNLTDPHHPTELALLDDTGGSDRQTFVQISPSQRYWPDSTRLAFSSDGRTLAIAGRPNDRDHPVRLWDLTMPQQPKELSTIHGHTDDTTSVAFSLNRPILATASWDHTVKLWDISNPHNPTESATLYNQKTSGLFGRQEIAHSIAFIPFGDQLVTIHTGYILVWETDINTAETTLCTIITNPITPTQWNSHFPDVQYHPPCP
jgi:WD40 repeat protein